MQAYVGRTHGAPYRGYGYVPLRFGGTSLGNWEHNKQDMSQGQDSSPDSALPIT